MSKPKLIVVLGATGAQGGGLARAILRDQSGEFAVRAVTRDVRSEKAVALAKAGAEVVAGDLDEPDTIARAFEGAYGAFCVTFYWDHFLPEKELKQATEMAHAARQAGLRHVIWSTLEDTRLRVPLDDDRMPTLMGRYKVPHFDCKGEADQRFRDAGVPTTFLLTSFYWENFISGMGPKPGPDGVLAITMPMGDKKLPGITVEDIGRCAYGIFRRGEALIGQTVGIAGEHLSGPEMAAAFSSALDREVVYNDVPPEVYRGFGFPGADDIANMFQYKRDFNDEFRAARNVHFSRELNPALQSFESWLAENRRRIPIAESAGA